MEKIYGNRSARDLDRAGGYFQRHMAHMTSENLNSKGDIALELAHRDMEIDALLARHNALVVEHAALLINNNALVEAVAWERECEHAENYINARDTKIWVGARREWWDTYKAARAEVDRLIAESAADCKEPTE